MAQFLADEGCDVVFGAAGGTGTEAIRWAAENQLLVIGVDSDEYPTTFMAGGGQRQRLHHELGAEENRGERGDRGAPGLSCSPPFSLSLCLSLSLSPSLSLFPRACMCVCIWVYSADRKLSTHRECISSPPPPL